MGLLRKELIEQIGETIAMEGGLRALLATSQYPKFVCAGLAAAAILTRWLVEQIPPRGAFLTWFSDACDTACAFSILCLLIIGVVYAAVWYGLGGFIAGAISAVFVVILIRKVRSG